ncbi:MAG: hypothetical protein KF838_04475 [Phycisphaeraceae bacterium]|nr:MAG: hypothetical protein KF838_04475 [Phycisphaeraceae bacterium]
MGKGKLRRFIKPDVLRSIAPDRLLRLLQPHEAYFTKQGFTLPASGEVLDLEAVGRSLMNVPQAGPALLVDTLDLIDRLSTPSGLDAIQRVRHGLGLPKAMTEERSAADVAVETWLENPDVLSRADACMLSTQSRTLRLFRASASASLRDDLDSPSLVSELKAALASRMNTPLDNNELEIYAFKNGDGVLYVVRRGGPYTRVGAIKSGKAESIGYVPLQFDFVSFDAHHRELGVKGEPVGERDRFRQVWGEVLGGDPEAFKDPVAVDLNPIRVRQRACLHCDDVPGIVRVSLVSLSATVQQSRGHKWKENAANLFDAWDAVGQGVPEYGDLTAATFEFLFDDRMKPRRVEWRQGGDMRVVRDDDAPLVQEWLRRRGFIPAADPVRPATFKVWNLLGSIADWSGTLSQWQLKAGAEFQCVKPFLIATGWPVAQAEIHERGLAGAVASIDTADMLVDSLTGEVVDVNVDEVLMWAIDLSRVCKAVAAAFGLVPADSVAIRSNWAVVIGGYSPFAGETVPVYFVTAPSPSALEGAASIIRGEGHRAIILTPTRPHAPAPRSRQLLGVNWIALDEFARLTSEGTCKLSQPVATILEPYLKHYFPERFGRTARPRFPTPPDALWGDVHIKFELGDRLSIRVGQQSGIYTHQEMDMADGRSKVPDEQWKLLRDLAEEHGDMGWESRRAGRKVKGRVKRLNDCLKAFFGISTNPITWKDKAYRVAFHLSRD